MRVLIEIEYNGNNFNGWQSQKNGLGVQNVLQDILSKLLQEDIKIVGSGRTDAGVHAICQKAHFDMNCNFDLKKLPLAVNFALPKCVRVLSAKQVDNNFNACTNAHKKTYLYKLFSRNIESPLKEGLYAHIPYPLDYENMVKASKLFLGVHNFKGFCSEGSSVKSFEREIYDLNIEQKNDEFWFYITGNGFLYNMVRRIVGALVEVGRHKISYEDIKLALNDYQHKHITKNMPACGLYLLNVEY